MGYPIAGWFTREHLIEMDDLGVPLFQETSNLAGFGQTISGDGFTSVNFRTQEKL